MKFTQSLKNQNLRFVGLIGILCTVGLFLRFRAAQGDYFGDEAWYSYLARTWGMDAHLVTGEPARPAPHLIYRPVFYGIHALFSGGGLFALRCFNILLGVAAIPLAATLAYRWSGRLGVAATAATLVTFHPGLIRYNALVFPDTLASVLILLSVLLFVTRRHTPTIVALTAALMAKESAIYFPVVLGILSYLRGERLFRIATFCIPLLWPLSASFVAVYLWHQPMQGWSTEPMKLDYLRHMIAGPELYFFAALLIWRRRVDAFLLWAAGPAFFLFWALVLGRGMSEWYSVIPAPTAIAAISVGAGYFVDMLASRFPKWSWRKATLPVAGSLVVGLALLWPSVKRAWLAIEGHHRDARGISQAAEVVRRLDPASVEVINCFWAFVFEPLRPVGAHGIRSVYRPDQAAHASMQAPVAVWCTSPEAEPSPNFGCPIATFNHVVVFAGCHDSSAP